MVRWFFGLIVLLPCAGDAVAGLYYSGEAYHELPAQWRGFLLDQKILRSIALRPAKDDPPNPARARYLDEAARLEKKEDRTADETADLGAVYVRLGESGKAIALLRAAQAERPNHFAIAANLGTAWQLQGDLVQAAACLEQAVRLAPGKLLLAEQHHLRLVQHRLKNPREAGSLDDLFDVRYTHEDGKYRPGSMSATEKKRLPAKAVAIAQQLALWLPADGPLLWQAAELASAHGDLRTAAAMMDGCVVQFSMASPGLRMRRKLTRAAAGPVATSVAESKSDHGERHEGSLIFASRRPLVSRLDATPLPEIDPTGINDINWPLIQDTTVDRKYKPTFPKHLRDLDGKEVRLAGFMQPIKAEIEMVAFFFIEYPVGCWFCESPETTGIVFVEIEEGQTVQYQRGLLRVVGRLRLNYSDPEDFLYTLRGARLAPVD